MKILTADLEREAIALINLMRSGTLSDPQLSDVVLKLSDILPDPNFMAYAIDRRPELPPKEVVQRAFDYKPVQL
jgi:hypothetical protein